MNTGDTNSCVFLIIQLNPDIVLNIVQDVIRKLAVIDLQKDSSHHQIYK